MGHHSPARRRAALVGPVLPWRGGIAQHTTMLARELGRHCDLKVISYTRQYPSWLYPGDSDRDAAFAGHEEPNTQYLLDALNPTTWKRALKTMAAHGAELAIFPWWTVYWCPLYFYLLRSLRNSGVETVFLCHNVVDHESAWWKKTLTRKTLALASRFVVHSRHEAERLTEMLGPVQIAITPHPIYEQFPMPRRNLQRRASVELLFFGFVRPYKGLDVLLDAMSRLKDEGYFLTIAGEFWEGLRETEAAIARLGLQNNVELIARYVPEEEAAELFSRADAVVLPYRSATGSGVIPLAYHYGKPVVASAVGGIPDVVEDFRTGLLVPPGSPEALSAAIRQLPELPADVVRMAINGAQQRFTWKALASAALGADG